MIIRQSQVIQAVQQSPGWGTVRTVKYGDAGGITQFGVAVQTLEPNTKASVRHWHKHVDEFLLVISGEVTVTENDGAHVLLAGDSACWPAGLENGHTVSNRSAAPCSYVIVGTRGLPDEGIYVHDDDIPSPQATA